MERAGHGAKIADVRQVLHDIEALRQEMLHVASRVRRP
jgi:hypothetical protein